MSQKMYDVSFAGSKVIVDGIEITDFMDDMNPIDIQDTELCNMEWSCNGRMIRTIKPSAVVISVTVIPGSPSDKKLMNIWKERFSNGGAVSPGTCDEPLTCVVQSDNTNVGSFTFRTGTCVAGAAAFTSNGQGKMGGNTYTFAFENVD